MKRILLVIGTRPQIIKSAPTIKEAVNWPDIEFLIVHTGQHYDYLMSEEFFREFSLPDPVVNLGVGSGPRDWQISQMLSGLENVYKKFAPDLVLIPGDTNSTFAGGLSAARRGIPLAHTESGARSFDWNMPEEVNRVVVDHISNLLFAPTSDCVQNLLHEGLSENRISLVGDQMYEILQQHIDVIRTRNSRKKFGLMTSYGVVTIHRPENETRLSNIISALNQIDIPLIFPCHPGTKLSLRKFSLRKEIKVVDPIPYIDMLSLLNDADILFTDSGGLQKEAFWLGTPCITLRNSTEWLDTIRAGANILVGDNTELILEEASRRIGKRILPGKTSLNASEIIIQRLNEWEPS